MLLYVDFHPRQSLWFFHLCNMNTNTDMWFYGLKSPKRYVQVFSLLSVRILNDWFTTCQVHAVPLSIAEGVWPFFFPSKTGVMKSLSCLALCVCENICVRACLHCFTTGFYSCMLSVREPSVFEVLCCCIIGSSQGGKSPIITISLWDCSVILPKIGDWGSGPYSTVTLCWCLTAVMIPEQIKEKHKMRISFGRLVMTPLELKK